MVLYKLFVCLSSFTLVLSKNYGFKLNISHSDLKFGSNINNYETRIFEGEFVKDIKEYPFMAFLYVSINKTNGLGCGGTIISPSFVLTAAHCVLDPQSDEHYLPKKTTLFVGSLTTINALQVEIKAHHLHPQYQENKCIDDFDVGILQLYKPLKFTQTVSSIVLAERLPLDRHDEDDATASKTTNHTKICKVLGWGKTSVNDETSALNRQLKETDVPLLDVPQCQNLLPGMCEDSQICSLDPMDKTGVCFGDSGGPLICDGAQVGIVSYVVSDSCVGPNLPNVYTRVDVYMKFINDIMSANNASKPSDWSDTLLKLLYLICIVVNSCIINLIATEG